MRAGLFCLNARQWGFIFEERGTADFKGVGTIKTFFLVAAQAQSNTKPRLEAEIKSSQTLKYARLL
jgi:hypothetical protein